MTAKRPKKKVTTKAERIQWQEQHRERMASTEAQLYTLRTVQQAHESLGNKFRRWLAEEINRVSALVEKRRI